MSLCQNYEFCVQDRHGISTRVRVRFPGQISQRVLDSFRSATRHSHPSPKKKATNIFLPLLFCQKARESHKQIGRGKTVRRADQAHRHGLARGKNSFHSQSVSHSLSHSVKPFVQPRRKDYSTLLANLKVVPRFLRSGNVSACDDVRLLPGRQDALL